MGISLPFIQRRQNHLKAKAFLTLESYRRVERGAMPFQKT